MIPGPAFIPFYHGIGGHDPRVRSVYGVPEGYIWQPATDWTGAGWVRPKGIVDALPAEHPADGLSEIFTMDEFNQSMRE